MLLDFFKNFFWKNEIGSVKTGNGIQEKKSSQMFDYTFALGNYDFVGLVYQNKLFNLYWHNFKKTCFLTQTTLKKKSGGKLIKKIKINLTQFFGWLKFFSLLNFKKFVGILTGNPVWFAKQ